MSTYGEFRVGFHYQCDCCTKFDDSYPAGLAKFDVLTEQQYAESIARINAAYAPDSCNCVAYVFCLVPILGCIASNIATKARRRRLHAAILRENAQFASENKRLPVRFDWVTTSITTTVRTNRRGRTHASSKANKTLILRVGTEAVLLVGGLGGQIIINNTSNTTVIRGDGNTVTGPTNNNDIKSDRITQIAVGHGSSAVAPAPPMPANQNVVDQASPPAHQPGQSVAV